MAHFTRDGNKKLASFHQVGPHSFKTLRQFDVQHHEEPDGSCRVHVSLVLEDRTERRLTLSFSNVSDLRFQLKLSGVGLNIESIQDRQWESCRYRVLGVEQDDPISLYCEDFDFELSGGNDH